MFKKLFSIFVAIAAILGVSAIAHADVDPDVYIRNISIPQNTFVAGDVVTGTFSIINGSPTDAVPNVVYQISLGANYDSSGKVGALYNTASYPAVFVEAGETKNVQFTYTLPRAFDASNLALHIQAYLKTGEPLGWSDVPLSVTGGLPLVSITQANVIVDGKNYGLGEGPMIYEGKNGTLKLTIKNPTSGNINLTPRITIYDRSKTNTALQTSTASDVSIVANGKAEVSYDLPTFDHTPRVYLGEIAFEDANGVVRSIPVPFRYIVSGDIVTISSVTSVATSVTKGQNIPIDIHYTGTPYDINTYETGGKNVADINVKLYNEVDELVGTYKGAHDFNIDTATTITVPATMSAQALRVELTVSKGTKVLATYSSALSGDYDSIREQTRKARATRTRNLIIGIAALIVAFVVILMILKHMNTKRRTLLVVLFFVSCAATYIGIQTVHAYTETARVNIPGVYDFNSTYLNAWGNPNLPNKLVNGFKPQGYVNPNKDGSRWHLLDCQGTIDPSKCSNFTPHITINSPGTVDKFQRGATFYFDAVTYARACLNRPQDIALSVTFNGKTLKRTNTDVNDSTAIDDHIVEATGGNSTFHIGPFTAPTTPGNYRLTFRVDNYTNIPPRAGNLSSYAAKHNGAVMDPATIGGYVTGYLNVVVVPPKPVVTLTANPTESTIGGHSNLTWTTTNSPTSCTATGNWSGNKAVGGGSQVTTNFTLNKTYTYTLTCTNAGGTSNPVTATVDVSDENDTTHIPQITLTANPNPVISGNKSTLLWTTTNNPTSCVASDGWTGSKATGGGSQQTGTLYTATTYTITCSNSYGSSGPVSVTVNVVPPASGACTENCPTETPTQPAVELFANPDTVNSINDYTTILTWNSNNADYCVSNDPLFVIPNDPITHLGMVNNSTGVAVGPLSASHGPYTFTIRCYNSQMVSSPGIASVQITVDDNIDGTCAPSIHGQHPSGNDLNTTVKKSIDWTFFPTGPVQHITWALTGLDIGTDQSQFIDSQLITTSYSNVGKKTATATVTGNGQTKTVTCSAGINVKPDPQFIEI